MLNKTCMLSALFHFVKSLKRSFNIYKDVYLDESDPLANLAEI